MKSDFKIRLYDFEVTPPEHLWGKIDLLLDENLQTADLGNKLYEAQINPPENVWGKIVNALDEKQISVVHIPFYKRVRPYYRYAAASVILAAMILVVNLLIVKKNQGGVAEETTTTPTTQSPSQGNSESKSNATVNTQKEPDKTDQDVRVIASTYKNNFNQQGGARAMTASYSYDDRSPAELQSDYSPDDLENKYETLEFPSHSINLNRANRDNVDRYIILLRPDGYIIRMSKKFADMIGCMYTSSTVTNNEECRDQLIQWRVKMAKAPVSSSPDNFMEILTLIKSLHDN